VLAWLARAGGDMSAIIARALRVRQSFAAAGSIQAVTVLDHRIDAGRCNCVIGSRCSATAVEIVAGPGRGHAGIAAAILQLLIHADAGCGQYIDCIASLGALNVLGI